MYHIIVNPSAGHGRSLKLIPLLETLFKDQGMAYQCLYTTAPKDACHMASYACNAHSEGIVGIGGDGTLQEIVDGMSHPSKAVNTHDRAVINTPLGIMPCGSGNDFALTLTGGKRTKNNIREAVGSFFSQISHKKTRTVDLIDVNGTAYLNIANIGLDARIVRNAAGLKKKFKHNAYLMSVFKSIRQHTNVSLRIEANGEMEEGPYTLVAVCNGQYYGGGMRIAPQARIDDGLMTVCLTDAMSRHQVMTLFPTILVEQHVRLSAVRYIQCEKLTLTLPEPETLCLDGNLYLRSGVLEFTVRPGALRLYEM